VMNANSWACDAGQQMRHEDDYHNPYSMGNTEAAIKGQCCPETCHPVMNANSWTCDAGKQMRHEYDFHDPYDHGDSESAIKGECCLETCHSVMNDKTLTCDSDLVTRDIYDYHKPSGGWEQTDDIIKHECCREPPAPPQCLAACLAPCGMPIEGDDLTPWCECFNNACYAPPGALDSCPTYGEDDDPSKDEIIEHVYDKPIGFQCTKPDFPPGTGVPNEGGPPPCIAHCFDQAPGEDYCPSDCDTSGCTENSNPPKSWIDTYFANNCSACITGENCDFSNGCPTSCDYSACTASTTPTYDEAAYYFANGCVKPHRLQCGNGMFLKNKNTNHEWCKPCQAGKFSPSRTKRNRRCKKCGINKYQKEEGSTSCTTCPTGFNTKGQRGKKQCFDAITGKSMKQLGIHPYPFGWKNEN